MSTPLRVADAERIAAIVAAGVRDVPDFPQPGVLFKDITPLLANPRAFSAVTAALAGLVRATGATAVAGIESRGFMLAAPAAERAGLAFWPVRKAGKLPGPVLRREYALEYGTAVLELSAAANRDERVLVVDDVLATGGTARAACELVEEAGARVVGFAVLLELAALAGRAQLGGRPVVALHTEQ